MTTISNGLTLTQPFSVIVHCCRRRHLPSSIQIYHFSVKAAHGALSMAPFAQIRLNAVDSRTVTPWTCRIPPLI
jgi:hypothetical protein